MSSKREQILSKLMFKLKALENINVTVYRNLDKPQKIPMGGMIILRDGESGEPEILLSPLIYVYEHTVILEVMVQNPDPKVRDSTLDNLLMSIGSLIRANRTLEGLTEWLEARTPDFQNESLEGAVTIRAATVPIVARFFTSDPLN
jgi:hypothetical protein